MTAPILDCFFKPLTSYNTSGDASLFGQGIGNYTISGSLGSLGLRLGVTGNASRIKRIEYDITPVTSTITACGYYDTNGNYHENANTISTDSNGHTVITIGASYSTAIDRIYTNITNDGATERTFSNLRLYDEYGMVLNMSEDETDYQWTFSTVYGNPSNNDGIYSNFSSSNCLQFAKPTVSSISSLNYSIRFTTGTVSSEQYIIGPTVYDNDHIKYTPTLYITSGGVLRIGTPQGSGTTSGTVNTGSTLSANTEYKLNCSWWGNTTFGYSLYEVATGNRLKRDTFIRPTEYLFGYDIILGANSIPTSSQPFTGSIDTSKSFIRINGVLIPGISEKVAPTGVNAFKFGSSDVSKIYFGSSEVTKIYLGSDVVYDTGSN